MVRCPYFDFNESVACTYRDDGYCDDLEVCPGNSDAWCRSVIECWVGR